MGDWEPWNRDKMATMRKIASCPLREENHREEKLPAKIMVKIGRNFLFVDEMTINWVKVDGSYLQVNTGENTYLIRSTLSDFITRLNQEIFYRINRTYCLNIARIREVRYINDYTFKVIMDDQTPLVLKERYRSKLMKALLAR